MITAENIRNGKKKYESIYTGNDTFQVLNMFAREQLLLTGELAVQYIQQATEDLRPGNDYPPEYDIFFLWFSLIFSHFLDEEMRVVVSEQKYMHIRLTMTELLASPIIRLSVLPSATVEVKGVATCLPVDCTEPGKWALYAILENKTSICIADVAARHELNTLRFFAQWIVRNWKGQGDITIEPLL